MHLKSIIFSLISWFIVVTSTAGNYRFGSIKTNDGLSDNQVNCILKDSKGFLWFGNRNGLNRYDGSKIKVFQHDKGDSTSISNNFIITVKEAGDNRLWIQTYNGLTIFDPSSEKFIRNTQGAFESLGVDELVSNYHIDKNKNAWLICEKHLFRYDFNRKKMEKFAFDKIKLRNQTEISCLVDNGKWCWVLYRNGFLEKRDNQSLALIQNYSDIANFSKQYNCAINKLYIDSDNDLWFFSLGAGVFQYIEPLNKWVRFNKSDKKNTLKSDIINDITQDKNGLIWIATDQGGMSIYNKLNNELTHITQRENDKYSLSHNALQCIYNDNTGIMWIGTYKQGVNFYHPDIFKFEYENTSIRQASNIPFNDVNAFLEDKWGNLWLGSNGSGLACKNKKTGKYTLYKHEPNNPNSLPSNIIVSLKNDSKGRIWIGTYLGGLSCFDGNRFSNFRTNVELKKRVSAINIWDIVFDPSGNIWIATLGGGVEGYDSQMNKIAHLEHGNGQLKSPFVLGLTLEYPILFISSAGGVDTYNIEKKKFVSFFNIKKGEKEIVTTHANLVYKDNRDIFWIGTLEGLNCYNPRNNELLLFTEKDGLPDNVIQTIVEDQTGNLWISTVKGVCKLTIKEQNGSVKPNFVIYNEKDGLQNGSLNYKAALRTSDHKIYFGGANGINYFTLKEENANPNEGEIVFTGFQIYNQNIQPGIAYNHRIVLKKSITITDKITLEHDENYFSIEFSALSYFMPQVTHYLYKLDGVNSQWIKTTENVQKASFTNLSSGTYTLLVKAVYKGGVIGKKTGRIQIEVLPPWWLSGWANFIYFLLLIAFTYAIYAQIQKRIKLNRERLEAEREHHLNESKLQFFTNISHEFRTPLTLILTPLEKIIDNTFDTHLRGQLEMMRRNANQLLILVNQILDFRKLELSSNQVANSQGDIVAFTKDILLTFSEGFEKKQLKAEFSSPVQSLWVSFDKDKLQKILSNLLSNALKFTPDGGQIQLNILLDIQRESKKAIVRFDVCDNGIGISDEDQAKIFDSFYQVPQTTQSIQGSGIGLHLVRKLVEIMSGTIELKSSLNSGSTFTVILTFELIESLHNLMDKTATPISTNKTNNTSKKTAKQNNPNLPYLLIVDDNDDVRTLLKDSFWDSYEIVEAENGVDGLEMAQELLPEIIITDLMMPLMDGIEMSKALKEDIRTSHIPIILLTAKVSDEVKLTSLKIGIDDYITKPFNMETLLLKVNNIKKQKQLTHKKFNDKMEINTQEIQISSLDEKLIQKTIMVIEENISNAEFTVEELSQQLNMSRVNMYKKMISITGKSPIEIIRIIRLKRSLQLLQKSQLSVAEIAYQVGFNTPRYFSKYFKEEYRLTPTEVREQMRENTLSEKTDIDDLLT